MKFYKIYKKEKEERLRMAEEHKMKYEQLMNTAYGNLKLQAKIEVVKQRQPLQTEPEDEEEE